jgi:hypothetical protein
MSLAAVRRSTWLWSLTAAEFMSTSICTMLLRRRTDSTTGSEPQLRLRVSPCCAPAAPSLGGCETAPAAATASPAAPASGPARVNKVRGF